MKTLTYTVIEARNKKYVGKTFMANIVEEKHIGTDWEFIGITQELNGIQYTGRVMNGGVSLTMNRNSVIHFNKVSIN